MKITDTTGIKSASELRRRRRVGESGLFSSFLAAAETTGAEGAHEASETASVSGISPLLSLQEVSEYEVERKKLVQHGHSLLDELEELRRQLLMGLVPLHTLSALGERLARQKQAFNDPKLIEIIEDIELRAAVELAKLEMARAARDA